MEKTLWIFGVCYLLLAIICVAVDDKEKALQILANETTIQLTAMSSGLNMLGNSIKIVREKEYKYRSPMIEADYRFSSPFDYREIINPNTGGTRTSSHMGLDIVGVWHCLIRPVALNGVVIDKWYPPKNGRGGHRLHGGYVRIEHPDGWISTYSHLSTIYVKEHDLLINGIFYRNGEPIGAGGSIGRQGNTGQSWGEHLHLAIQQPDGEFVNPLWYINDEGVIE